MPNPILRNTAEIEIWPARLLRARGNHHARLLSRAHHVLRRKRDGRYLAAVLPEGIAGLLPAWRHQNGIDAALELLDAAEPPPRRAPPLLALSKVEARLEILGLDARAYAENTGLELMAEPAWLTLAGFDRYRRPLWLEPASARAWQALQQAAWIDGITLEAVSGYRSHDYQLGIFERKRQRGLAISDILAVNAAPGYSEHHTGSAVDISTPGEPSAETSFERTAAFEWLGAHAKTHGFTMSYPRDNPHGIIYEPWHWRYRPVAGN